MCVFIMWLCRVLAVARGLFLVSREIFHCSARILYLSCEGSGVVACTLSCSGACGILVPQSGIESRYLALQGRCLTTRPSEKSPPAPLLLNSLLFLCRCRRLSGVTESAASTAPCLCTCLARSWFCWRPVQARTAGGTPGAGV